MGLDLKVQSGSLISASVKFCLSPLMCDSAKEHTLEERAQATNE